MPTTSEAQRRWGYGTKGAAWMKKHHMDNPGKLPERKKKKRRKSLREMYRDKHSKKN
jgi:hypothetical protein